MKVSREYLINEYKRVLRSGLIESETFCLYLHNPFCCNVCSYCMFHPTNLLCNVPLYREYYDRTLPAQLEEIEPLLQIRPLDKVYFGGGTASVMKPSFIDQLYEKIPDFRGIPQKETEINPNHVSPHFMKFLKENQFNHISIGVQSFDQDTLDGVGRKLCTPEHLKRLVGKLRQSCPDAYINIDLMAFLKDQSPAGAELLLDDLEILKSIDPDGISVYPNYNVVLLDDDEALYEYISSLRNVLNQFVSGSEYKGYPEQLTLDRETAISIALADYLLFKGGSFGKGNLYNCTGFFSDSNESQITIPIGAHSKSLYGFIRDTKYQAANKEATEFEIIKKHNGGYWNGR